MLYFFFGRGAAVITHGLTKRREVPAKEIDMALRRQEAFTRNPQQHTHTESTR
jgi:hypothetical protein